MPQLFSLLVLLFFFLATAPAQAEPTVIVLSLDGVRSDYPERASLPALERVAREGMRADRMRPVFPANTFPNAVSLATGTHPDKHGIVDNRFWDRDRGLYDYGNDASWLDAEPLWAAAERQGVWAATYYWVGSETPWRGQASHYVKAPYDRNVGEQEKVDQILAWLALPENERPGLIMSWWGGADYAGHRFGPDAPEVVEALKEQDAQLARLLAGIDARGGWDDVTLLVVSDHGMLAIESKFSLADLLKEAGIAARVEERSSVAHIFLKDPDDADRAERVIAGEKGLHAYRPDTLPEALRLVHPRRSGDVIVLIDPPRAFGKTPLWQGAYLFWRRLSDSDAKLGTHGYDPSRADMGTIFYAMGRGVTPGHREREVRSIDVAPTVAGLLGIDPPSSSEGAPIVGVGPGPN